MSLLARAARQRVHTSLWRFINTERPSPTPRSTVVVDDPDDVFGPSLDEQILERRRRKTEWKRRQNRQTFMDHLIIHVRGGRGGDGCVSFHRDAMIDRGPPSGGNGGRGGNVYVRAVDGLTTLSNISTRCYAKPGENGKGTWLHGKHGEDRIIDVPVGTVVREVTDPAVRIKDAWEEEFERVSKMDKEEGMREMRARRWLHYPLAEDNNVGRTTFKEAEQAFYRTERKLRWHRKQKRMEPVNLDFDLASEDGGVMVAEGGIGGYGNPFFVSTPRNRSPKYATRGFDGERITLELELKLVADVGLVGFPNAGKSTLLRALTNSKAEVASHAFTTLNPQIGIVQVWEDGSFAGARIEGEAIEDSVVERQREAAAMVSGEDAPHKPRDEGRELKEVARFTIADNPGLVEHASDNVGLGHAFLRAIERCRALVYVVDLSGPAPWEELAILERELEAYKPGLSTVARLVLANKADLLASDGDADAVTAARAKLARLEEYVSEGMNTQGGGPLDILPVSAKHSLNLRRVVELLRVYLADAAEERAASSDAENFEDD
ncbi:GTP-binding protein Obg/CgtA [Auriculariales sp. MPI-PUGE-AT-0066]|nr:GTP-binding protein Obg/CgtA [Auriculariales sp. MPI-PUGE-AT-0066]